jgi:23S rRNA (adenine2030-N6)-methyltransferase
MKYRHSHHAGNFADVHKHVTLLALIGALQKKDKGFFYLDTHAGRGSYDLSSPRAEAVGGIGRLAQAAVHEAAELRAYQGALATLRTELKQRHLYAGSPLLGLAALRPQDRAVLIELEGGEAHSLEAAVSALAQARAAPLAPVRVERGDGFQRLKAWLPPPERRGLTFIDPPYEEPEEFARVSAALAEGLRRFPTGVQVAWYPIKDERTSSAWQAGCARTLGVPTLASELWLFRRDSRVALNGSGLLIVNPPHLILERMQVWLPELLSRLRSSADAGSSARMLSESPR